MKFEISENAPEIVPFKAGRRTDYTPRMCEIVVATAEAGGFRAAMCVNCGISNSTFANYIREYPDFAEAVEYAELVLLAQQEALLTAGAQGKIKNYDFRANSYILNNKYRHIYDKTTGSTEVNINTINLTPEQINEQIAKKYARLRAFGVDIPVEDVKAIDYIEVEKDGE